MRKGSGSGVGIVTVFPFPFRYSNGLRHSATKLAVENVEGFYPIY